MPDADSRLMSQEVRDYLNSALPTSRLKEVSASPAEEPLLLLTMPQLVAGFGFAKHDIEAGYDQLYETFKDTYSDHRSDWERLELAFVMCVPANSPGLDHFGPTVETDVYFCRKYVVPFSEQPVENVLARLPFVPLVSSDQETIRPPSAQTFLQQCNVPPTLAKYVVVSGERSPARIVEDCMEGTFGRPKRPTRSSNLESSMALETAAPMRVKSVAIENFRAYRKSRKIEFGEDLTFLYGPNGFGKTSVFDALDFAFTGDIGRLRINAEERFRRVANHLDRNGAEGTVALSFVREGEQHRIVRRVNDRRSAKLDGLPMNRKSALEEITGWSGSAADRVGNLISLFRATHLFSQEHQELASNFRQDCELSSDVVSRLLAFEDYHSGRNKAALVCGVVRSKIAVLEKEMAAQREELAAGEGEVETLGRAVDGVGASTDWEGAVSSLYERVEMEGLEVPTGDPDLETLRGWRTTFATRGARVRAKMEELRRCLRIVDLLPRRRSELAVRKARLEKVKAAVNDAARRRDAAVEEHAASVDLDRMSSIKRELTDYERSLKRLSWLEKHVPRYADLVREEAETHGRLKAAQDRAEETQTRERVLSERLRNAREARSDVLSRAEQAGERLAEARGLLAALGEWTRRWSRVRTIDEEMARNEQKAGELELSEQTLSETIQAAEQDENQLRRRIGTLEERRGELSALVAQIQYHIDGGVCPVCGEDHGSAATLLDRIAEHLGEDVAKEERLRLDVVRGQRHQLDREMDELRASRRNGDRARSELLRDRESLMSATREYERSLAHIGVEDRRSKDAVQAELEGLRSSWERASMDLQSRSSEALSSVQQTQRDLDAAMIQSKSAKDDVIRRESDRARITLARQRLTDDPRAQGDLGLEAPLEAVSERRESIETRMQLAHESLEELRPTIAAQDELLSRLAADLASKEQNLASSIEDVAQLAASCRDMEETLGKAGINEGAGEGEVSRHIELLEKKHHSLDALIKTIVGAEQVVDAATTKAAFSRLQARVRQRRAALVDMAARRESYVWWFDYFEELQGLLSSEQNKAVSGFTEVYGPRTSAIQRRLRAVYGFDDIEIRSEESKISVRVSRQGTWLRPTDYFSQSQQQTLLLGLFLTAAVSQTWSTMAPVFLDDPVTHFDDLNTYAFLDLIDGLLNDQETGGRQFVISTCDERLLRLARQKFAYLNDRGAVPLVCRNHRRRADRRVDSRRFPRGRPEGSSGR